MSAKRTMIYIHFRKPIDFSALADSFPDSAYFAPIMENSILVSSFLTYKAVLDLMERDFQKEEYFICVASRHCVVNPVS